MKIDIIHRTAILVFALILFVSCNSQNISPLASPNLVTGTPDGAVSTDVALPTLSPTLISGEILSLYNENGSCNLPCWWGITPGKTSIQEVYDRFSLLGEFRNDTRPGNNYETIILTLTPPEEIDLFNMGKWSLRFVVSNGIVEGITTRIWYIKSFSTPTVAKILETFGMPKEIWVRVSPRMIGPPFYEMALFYPEGGILVFGKGDAQIIAEEPGSLSLSICPQNMPVIYDVDEHYPMIFHLTLPGKYLSFEELNHSQLYGEPYRLMDNQITDMNTQRFYEIYLNPLAEECFNLSLPAK